MTALQAIIAGAILLAVVILYALIQESPRDPEDVVFIGTGAAIGIALLAGGASKAIVK